MQIDATWYERLDPLVFDPIFPLALDQESLDTQFEQFKKSTDRAPAIQYPDLKRMDCVTRSAQLQELRAHVSEKETSLPVRRAYEWKLGELLGHSRLVHAAQQGNDTLVVRLSMATYGVPRSGVFRHLLAMLRAECAGVGPDIVKQDAVRRIAEKVDLSLGDYSTYEVDDLGLPPIKESVKEDRQCTSEEVCEIFQQVLDKYELDGWRVAVDSKRKRHTIVTNHTRRIIFIPGDAELHTGRVRPLTRVRAEALAEHEAGVHVRRRVAGAKSPLALLERGLDRYLPGEEGLAVYAEQCITGAPDFARSGRYLAICFTLGLDGTLRDYRDVYDLMVDIYTVRASKEGEEAREYAESIAWKLTARIFRGTSGTTPGACLTKDIAYRDGNIGIWELAQTNSSECDRFFVGKYDPTNRRHRWILDQLGIGGDLA